MKRQKKQFFQHLVVATTFACSLSTSAQDFPTDGGPWSGNGTGSGPSWAGDTIIHQTPIGGTGNPTHRTPSLSQSICAIYNQGFIFLTANNEITFSYAVLNEEQYPILRGQDTTTASSPAIINITTLPPGHYTFLLYINNECLEGEFEK